MSNFNLPPGCSQSDLPGWHEIERDIDFNCGMCKHEWTEHDLTVDARGDHDVEADCPKCKAKNTSYYPSTNE